MGPEVEHLYRSCDMWVVLGPTQQIPGIKHFLIGFGLPDLWVLKGNTTSMVTNTVQAVYTALNDSQLFPFNSNSVKKVRQ